MNNVMKIKFDSNLDYQNEAINSVINIFKDIQTNNSKVLVSSVTNLLDEGYGFSNKILNSNYLEIIRENIKNIQEKNKLPIDINLTCSKDMIFDTEMETGTGKTYVFLKTILELNKNYNFTKFIIVVPSVAIREGVLKNLEITKEHFLRQYNNVNYNYFVYNSSRLSFVRNFSTSSDIEIMIINIQNFEKDSNIFNNYKEQLSGEKPIDLVSRTNPIVIIDEPQTTTSTDKSMDVIYSLNPLFILRYSATFKKGTIKNLVYRLDPIDAYEKKLVKRIEVYSSEIVNEDLSKISIVKIDKNCSFVNISYYDNNGNKCSGKFNVGQNICSKSNREEHKDYVIEEITTSYVTFSNSMKLEIDSSNDKNDDLAQISNMMKKLIEVHLDKQLDCKKIGVKVLSLFFLDEVKNYRVYNDDGYELGIYGKIFEEKFKNIANSDKYKSLFENINIDEYVSKVHNGYFAQDKQHRFKDSKCKKDEESARSADDEIAYNLIMKDKERLLSFDEPVSFIFSHTALKEGWDNPNIFQIYVLSKSNTQIKKRQQIGRGLRLCVDQNGNRITDENINRLTIFSNESFAKFASALQKEFIDETSCFNINNASFINNFIDHELSVDIYNELIKLGFIDKNNKITDKVYNYLSQNHKLLDNYDDDINEHIKKVLSKKFIKIKNANNFRKNSLNPAIRNDKNFKDLWNSISMIKKINITFNDQEYLNEIKNNIKSKLENLNLKTMILKHVDIELNREDVVKTSNETTSNSYALKSEINRDIIPKIINNLVQTLKIKKSSLIDLICETDIYKYLDNHPYAVERILKESIESVKNSYSISYEDTNKYYDVEKLFNSIYDVYSDESYLFSLNDLKVEKFGRKTLYRYTKLQSEHEYKFLNSAIQSDKVLTILKLPNWYHIPLPNGNYIPDFALKIQDVDNPGNFAIEIKGSMNKDDLRVSENFRIECGKKFYENSNNVTFKKCADILSLLTEIEENDE